MKISYITLGTNNMPAAVNFYNALFEQEKPLQTLATDRMTFWQFESFAFAVAIPFDEEQATNGNGTMIGFDVGSIEAVKQFYQQAIELGGSSEGKPSQKGPRFSGYVRDLDNNKLCFFV